MGGGGWNSNEIRFHFKFEITLIRSFRWLQPSGKRTDNFDRLWPQSNHRSRISPLRRWILSITYNIMIMNCAYIVIPECTSCMAECSDYPPPYFLNTCISNWRISAVFCNTIKVIKIIITVTVTMAVATWKLLVERLQNKQMILDTVSVACLRILCRCMNLTWSKDHIWTDWVSRTSCVSSCCRRRCRELLQCKALHPLHRCRSFTQPD